MERLSEQTMLTQGEYVMYNGLKLCRFDGVFKKKFDGLNEKTYYKLTPSDNESSVYYVSQDKIDEKIRKLHTKDEVYSIIDSMPDIEPVWYDNNNERKMAFQSLLKSNDYKSLILIIRSVYIHSKHQSELGKKTSAVDETVMKTAENIIYQEFSHVLGITVSEVKDFISERLDDQNI
ncbi:MAG: CarD family transcriptional regulator [Oscillospiraceae bacterium]|nr:CarD family transcriptional regulator [Oscillospiraceae bacterium]